MPEGHFVMRGKVVLAGTFLPGIKAVPRGKLFPGLRYDPLTLLAVKKVPL